MSSSEPSPRYSLSLLFSGVDTDLPSDLQEEATRCMEAAVAQKMNIGDCIQKVQKDVLSKCNERYAGKRYKGFIKFEYESNVINITVFKPSFFLKQ